MATNTTVREAKTAGGEMRDKFPARAFIQVFEKGNLPGDYALVAAEMKALGVPVVTKETDDILIDPLPLTRKDLVVGNFDWTRIALKQFDIPMPQPPDYPKCLEHLLHRKIWRSTMGEVQSFLKSAKNKMSQVFIKPAAHAKIFAAIIEPKDQMLDTLLAGVPGVMKALPPSTPVYCAELIDMVSEFRAYVVNGEIRALCQYRGPRPGDKDHVELDMKVVKDAVRTLCESEEGRHLKGCGVDFAVIRKEGKFITCLIEVNDGYSLGRYEGVSGKDYTDLLVARWHELMVAEK